MPSYILRNLDPDLWEKFKARAAQEGRGLKFVILRLVELYTKYGLERIEAPRLDATTEDQLAINRGYNGKTS